MAIENFDEIKSYFETNKDSDEVKGYVSSFINADGVSKFLETDDGKKFIQPTLDKYHSKSLKTWQDNNLSKLVDEEVNKRFPKIDPKDKEIAELKAQFEKAQKETARDKLTNKALKVATEQKLPTDLVDYFIGDDEDTTNKNLEKFMAAMSAHDEAIKTEFAKGNSYSPPLNKGGNIGDEKARAEIAKYLK